MSKTNETLTKAREEITSYHAEMCEFKTYEDIKKILLTLSGYSARAMYIRNAFIRSPVNEIMRFRIDELDPFLNEVDRQFKVFSRLATLYDNEREAMNKGQ